METKVHNQRVDQQAAVASLGLSTQQLIAAVIFFRHRRKRMFYTAVFKPSKTMDYSDQAKKLAGKQIAVQDGWIIQDGPFEGQQCYYIPNSHVGWIPACDLKELEPISYTRWQEIVKSLKLE